MIGAAERAILYRLFARLLTEAPDDALLALLGGADIVAVLDQAEPGLAAWPGGDLGAVVLPDAAVGFRSGHSGDDGSRHSGARLGQGND